VGERQIDVQVVEDIGQPVPAPRGLDDRLMRPGGLGEVALEAERCVRDALLFNDGAVGPVRGTGGRGRGKRS